MAAPQGVGAQGRLRRLLDPRSVAVIGATPRPGAFGERVLANLADFRGRIHLVNARYQSIGGWPCHPSVTALPEPPDCAVVAVPGEAVEGVLQDCIAAGAGGAIVFASGYAETGEDDRVARQDRLAALARVSGMPVLGPNCIGIANYASHARITFMPTGLTPLPGARAVGVVSQSGALGFSLSQAVHRGAALSHVLTCGNACDVDLAALVTWLADEPGCAAIALLFEGMAGPGRLAAACAYAGARGKPVVACKLATGAAGAAAALSHTGSLAGSQAAYRAAFARAGVVLVEDYEALIETACFLVKAPPPRVPGVAVIATSGGAAIMAADKAEAHGIALPQPDAPTRAALAARIPAFGSPRNPCDVTAQVLNDPDSLSDCGHALLCQETVGALVVPNIYASPAVVPRLAVWSELQRRHGKPVCLVWVSDWWEGPGAAEAEASDIALFRSMDRCFAALSAWLRRGALAEGGEHLSAGAVSDAVRAEAAALLAQAGPVLTEREAKRVLALYGVPVTRERLAADGDAAADAAAALGYPVALKLESPDVPHKTEAGVIRLELRTEAELRTACADILAAAAQLRPAPRITGLLVQEMAPRGVEVLAGARVDPLFGPMVVVGLGGVLVEVLKDSAVGLAPLRAGEAEALLRGLKGAPLLDGVRGAAPVEMAALCRAVEALAAFVADHRETVAEIDVNPLICTGGRVVAVDALIVRR